jgi:hypothetical protein
LYSPLLGLLDWTRREGGVGGDKERLSEFEDQQHCKKNDLIEPLIIILVIE